MTPRQRQIVDYLRSAGIAATGKELATLTGDSLETTFDNLRVLEDMGEVCGAEIGWYRAPNTRRKRG